MDNKKNIEMVSKQMDVNLRKVHGTAWADDVKARIEAIKLSTGIFDNYVAANIFSYTPCHLACDSDCENCPFAGKEDEYVIREMVNRLVSTKSAMASEDANTQFIYGDLLNIALVLNELTNKKMTLYAEHVRAMANRMLEIEISICCELVEKMLYMAAILVDVDINIIMKVG